MPRGPFGSDSEPFDWLAPPPRAQTRSLGARSGWIDVKTGLLQAHLDPDVPIGPSRSHELKIEPPCYAVPGALALGSGRPDQEVPGAC